MSLDGVLLEECCKVFFAEFLNNRDKVPSLIASTIDKCFNEKLDIFISPEERLLKDDPFKAAEKAQEIFKNLKILLEVADKGNKGLLTGDLHPKMIDGFCKVLP